jgi:YfiH family protein
MLIHNNPLFSIYFGNADDKLSADQYLHYPAQQDLLSIEPYKRLMKLMHLDDLLFLNQIHSDKGVTVSERKQFEPFALQGDYLITDQKHIGIGIMTGDCLPIIFYDNLHNVAAIVHAGWKGSVAHIAIKALADLQNHFGTKVEHVRIFFGPSAKSCCYQVGPEFEKYLEQFSFADQILYKEEKGIMFDLPLCNKLQLEHAGVAKEAFRLQYNSCTICDPKYCSYRREGDSKARQMTVVVLR